MALRMAGTVTWPEVPDPEDLALERPLSAGDDEAQLAELAVEGLPVETLWHPGAGYGVGCVGRVGQELEAEGCQARPDRRADGRMTLPDFGQCLLLDEVQGHVKLEHDRHGWCPGRLAGLGAGLVGGQIEVELRHLGDRSRFPGARRDRHEAQAGGNHPGLLGTAHDNVQTPGVCLERDGPEAADRVNDDQCVRRCRLDSCGQLGDRVGDGRGSLVLGQQHGLPGPAGRESLAHLAASAALPHSEATLVTFGAVGGSDLGEAIAEGADGHREDLVAGGEEVDDRRLEAARARCREDQDIVLGLVSRLEALDYAVLENGELRTAVVDHLAGASLADGVRQRRSGRGCVDWARSGSLARPRCKSWCFGCRGMLAACARPSHCGIYDRICRSGRLF